MKKNPNLDNLTNIDKLEVSPLGLKLSFLLNQLLEDKEKIVNAEFILKDFRYSKANTKDSLFYLDLFNQNYQIDKMDLVQIRKFLSKLISYTGKREIDPILKGLLSYLKIYFDENTLLHFQNTTIGA